VNITTRCLNDITINPTGQRIFALQLFY